MSAPVLGRQVEGLASTLREAYAAQEKAKAAAASDVSSGRGPSPIAIDRRKKGPGFLRSLDRYMRLLGRASLTLGSGNSGVVQLDHLRSSAIDVSCSARIVAALALSAAARFGVE
jgi:hypothetical protein